MSSDNKCIDKCADGTYASKMTMKCEKCPKGCTTCDSEEKCTGCSAKYTMTNGKCEGCDDNCKTCKNKICEKCNEKLFLDKNK
jgi:hypothetical protein